MQKIDWVARSKGGERVAHSQKPLLSNLHATVALKVLRPRITMSDNGTKLS